MELYVVTQFGCNSTPSELWVPDVKIFTDKAAAYEFYRKVAPRLDDLDNLAKKITSSDGNWECIVQLPGYYNGMGDRSKRPSGAKIECIQMTMPGSSCVAPSAPAPSAAPASTSE
jgi:hypothetical protein